jgi:transposase
MRSEGCTEKTALQAIGISRATYYRWMARWKKLGVIGLEPGSRKPHKVKQPTWTDEIRNLVIETRRKFPMWGRDKIAVILKREYQIEVSASMVGRILHPLFESGEIKRVSFYYGKKNKKKRKFLGHAEKWEYGMKAEKPGELLQIDHCSVNLGNCVTIKHFKAVCPITKICVEQAYSRATSATAARFLKYVKKNLPFKIKSIQVDGGSEFMKKFEGLCQKEKIPLYVLPPRSPQFNSHVERGNSTVKYEFYNFYNGRPVLCVLRKKLRKFVNFYNVYRPHQYLHYQTPLQYYHSLEGSESHM